ncbi:MAG: SGNH/GDSL hydrolase family protein [Cyanobacteria bacterium P01_H01_bin.21]
MSESRSFQGSRSVFNFTININAVHQPEPPSFDRLYVFGDSLSDNGNEFIGLNYVQENIDPHVEIDAPAPPYFPGRESNGLVWTDYLAQDLGLDLTPVLELADGAPVRENDEGAYDIATSFGGNTATHSVNFAFSGARLAADDSEPGDLVTPSVSSQVDLLLDDLATENLSVSEEGLYVVQGGANDYLSGDYDDPTEPVASIAEAITDLYDAGARYFLVPNLADIGNTPIGRDLSEETSRFLSDLSGRHNDLLETTLRKLERDLSGISIESPDFRALTLDVANDPTAFGLTNGTDAYLVGESPDFTITGDDPDDYFYWDYIHPTTVGQELLADIALEDTLNLNADCSELMSEALQLILGSFNGSGSELDQANTLDTIQLTDQVRYPQMLAGIVESLN